ncbi:hypothetical protein J2S00_003941 [Caldalkalibacillus uzonensis]|uniref:Uncharacterized protein n=1 Tax=Caldalkalibacillus uzonensis TaxID=353224 RepID=A0ABU0CY84_9BACI|nr:hypothetical protein [Caldalkalibacillus uzonensis]MDQ0341097.1 hypothetical protein [Caldalkalibacillus uzonensis]
MKQRLLQEIKSATDGEDKQSGLSYMSSLFHPNHRNKPTVTIMTHSSELKYVIIVIVGVRKDEDG